jgi:hypothetical protein
VSVAHEERRAPDLVGTALLVARAPQRVHASERAPASWPLFLLAPHHSPPAV